MCPSYLSTEQPTRVRSARRAGKPCAPAGRVLGEGAAPPGRWRETRSPGPHPRPAQREARWARRLPAPRGLKGAVGSLPTLWTPIPCALRCGCFIVSLRRWPVAGVCWGMDSYAWGWGLQPVTLHVQGTAPSFGPGERCLCWRALPEARTGLPGQGLAHGCPCLEMCGAWEICQLCAAGTTARLRPRFFPSPACVRARGALFFRWLSFCFRGDRGMGSVQRTDVIFLHICDPLACVSTLFSIGIEFPSCWLTGRHGPWLWRGAGGLLEPWGRWGAGHSSLPWLPGEAGNWAPDALGSELCCMILGTSDLSLS